MPVLVWKEWPCVGAFPVETIVWLEALAGWQELSRCGLGWEGYIRALTPFQDCLGIAVLAGVQARAFLGAPCQGHLDGTAGFGVVMGWGT